MHNTKNTKIKSGGLWREAMKRFARNTETGELIIMDD